MVDAILRYSCLPAGRPRMKNNNMTQPSYLTKPKACTYCEDNIHYIDYKDVKTLRKYLSPYARIMSRNRTGTCAKHQRAMAKALKRARYMGLLPYLTR